MQQQARAHNLTVRQRMKQIDDSFSCIRPVIDNEFCHKTVKVVCRLHSAYDETHDK